MRRGHSQYVTGLSVSDKRAPHAPRRLKKNLRWRLHIIEKFGYEKYMLEFGGELRDHYPKRLLGLARYVASQEPISLGARWLQRWEKVLPHRWPDDEAEMEFEHL